MQWVLRRQAAFGGAPKIIEMNTATPKLLPIRNRMVASQLHSNADRTIRAVTASTHVAISEVSSTSIAGAGSSPGFCCEYGISAASRGIAGTNSVLVANTAIMVWT